MAAVAASASASAAGDQAADLLQNLSLDSEGKNHDASEITKTSPKEHGSVIGGEARSTTPTERSSTPLPQDIFDYNVCYVPTTYSPPAYFYRGYDAPVNVWDRYVNHDGLQIPPTEVYGDAFQQGYGYASYSTYPSPGSQVPAVVHDGQMYNPQNYHYQPRFFQSPQPSTSNYTPHHGPTSQGEVTTTGSAGLSSHPIDANEPNSNGIGNGGRNGNDGSLPLRPSNQNSTLSSNGSYVRVISPAGCPSGHQDSRFGYDGMQSPTPWFDGPLFSNGQQRPTTANSVSSTLPHSGCTASARNQTHSMPHLPGLHASRPASAMASSSPGCLNRIYPNNQMHGQFGNTLRSPMGFGPVYYDPRTDGRWSLAVDSQYKHRGRGSGFCGYRSENLDELSESHRGPRCDRFKNQKGFGSSVTIAVKGQKLSLNSNEVSGPGAPDKDLYNHPDFPESYSDAKFFVIKSYSEDDIHKSIKYNVWASTPNGNKKLDAAYEEAQEKAGGCPIFLFFSVNTSGQFVGVAEMVGPVDFNKTMDYWQQDKWNGCFPVKWHIVKDVPNSILKHITLENNDNKPVTNSRDTQEVKLEQGLQMLRLFKEHVSKTSMLDDFMYYENRQKLMQEKRFKQLQKQAVAAVIEEKEKDGVTGKARSPQPFEPVKILSKETVQGGLRQQKPPEENSPAAVAGESLMVAKLPIDEPAVNSNADV